MSHLPLDVISGISRNTAILIADFTAYPGRITPSTSAMIRQHKTVTAITATAFAMDMLILKFIQGIPVVGILGGAANPVYYHKVMQYVKLKYRKRYLLGLSSQTKI